MNQTEQTKQPTAHTPHTVVIGGGFGGIEVAKRLCGQSSRTTLIDRNNYHLFQPLLYQVGTGGLSPANISTPFRAILGRRKNCQFVHGNVTDINLAERKVRLGSQIIPFDYLVVAAGAVSNYFGNDHWKDHSSSLKSLEDAIAMRRKIYLAFEKAEQEDDVARRRALMTFVVVGGGPTGVELAGALSEIARYTLKHDFRNINPSESKIILVETGSRVLSQYDEKLCLRAKQDLEKLGVEVRLDTKVTDIGEQGLKLDSETGQECIATHTVLWSAGVTANPLAKTLAEQSQQTLARGGRVPVRNDLSLAGFDNVFVIGDMAAFETDQGELLPGVAPVAIQQGKYVADSIAMSTRGETRQDPFRYRDLGSMATIGRAAAIAELGKFKFAGLSAWLLWLFVHVVQIMQFPNRLLILIQWAWNYLTFNRAARLITGTDLNGSTTATAGAEAQNESVEPLDSGSESEVSDEHDHDIATHSTSHDSHSKPEQAVNAVS
jgi:NADH dehydrogenase